LKEIAMMSLKHLLWVLLIMTAVPLTARADHNAVYLKMSNTFIKDPGFDAISNKDRMVQVELSYSRAVLPIWEGHMWVEGSWTAGSLSSSLFNNAFQTDLFLQQIHLGVKYSLPLLQWIEPFIRFDLGVAVGSFELSQRTGDTFKDRAVAFTGQILAGVEILMPRRFLHTERSGFTFGVLVEGGYSFATAMRFGLVPEEDDRVRAIPALGSTLGTLKTSGGQVRLGVVFHF